MALVSLAVALVVAAGKLVVGLAAGSLAVLSDAVHSALDAGATALTLFAVRLADKPPDREHPFGHGRVENLAALAESGVLVSVGILVGIEAIRRLVSDTGTMPESYAAVVISITIVIDLWRSRALRRAARRYQSQALEADALNFSADVLGSLAVLAGLIAARAGFGAADSIAALVVVVLVCFIGLRLGRSAVDVLMDRAPEGVDDRLREAARGVDGVVDVSEVRVRRSGPHTLAELTVSVGRTASVERSHEIAAAVRDEVARAVPGAEAVVHFEPSEAGEDVVRRVFAAANRLGLADQIHNVLAIRHPEGTWLMLHAKVAAETPLRRAHEVTDLLEVELRREITGLARVEIHLEPLEPQTLEGRVVTTDRSELASAVAEIAHAHPPIERCHEVAVTETGDGLHLVLHCEAPPGRTIAEIHSASLGVEGDIHQRFPGVASVTVHFEPSGA